MSTFRGVEDKVRFGKELTAPRCASMASSFYLYYPSSPPLPFPPPNPSSSTLCSSLSFLRLSNALEHPCKKMTVASNCTHVARATQEGLPSELIEDSKFVPLNADDPKYGPPALLLLGFEPEEIAQIQELLKEMDGEFLKIIQCTEEMTTLSLWEAINTQPSSYFERSKIAESLPRICFLSGLTGEEMMMFIDVFPETGLEPAVFAAVVPNSASKPLMEVVEEIMGDHDMLSQRRPESS